MSGTGSGGADVRGPGDLVVLTVEVEGLSAPRPPQHADEFTGPVVATVVVEPVPEAVLFGGVTAGDDVDQQPPATDALEGGGLLGSQGRGHQPGSEGHQEIEACRVPGQGRRGQPGVLAPGAGRGEHRLEAQLIRRPGDLGQIVDVRGPASDRGAEPDDLPAVARGGKEPVDVDTHRLGPVGITVITLPARYPPKPMGLLVIKGAGIGAPSPPRSRPGGWARRRNGNGPSEMHVAPHEPDRKCLSCHACPSIRRSA